MDISSCHASNSSVNEETDVQSDCETYPRVKQRTICGM